MPAGFAHYRFGAQVLPALPAEIRPIMLQHRALFDIGVQGPDFLFFHSFFKQTPLYRLGNRYHEESGKTFFTRMCAHVAAQPTARNRAYLTGLLAHYCLDCGCHPFVYAVTGDSGAEHSQLETEFDRYLMTLDGIKKPHETNISRHLRLRKEEYATVAGFYPEVSVKETRVCIRSMALAQKLLALPTAPGHKTVELFTRFAGGNTGGKVMTVGPDPRWTHLNGKMLDLYRQALERFPVLLIQLNHHMAHGTALGDDFKANFDRG